MSPKTLPVVDEAYTQRIFTALATMEVSLDSDPLTHGPKRMNAKIAVCRNHLDRCQQIYLQMSNDHHVLNRAMRLSKVEFDLRMQDMLTNDPETRAGRSVRDREAIATMKLRAEREAVADIESSISDLDAVMTVVKAKRDDLKDTLGRIRDQLKLCQEEIGLGERWGTAPAPGQRVPPPARSMGVDPSMLALLDETPGEGEASLTDLERIVNASLAAQDRADAATSAGTETGQVPPPPDRTLAPFSVDASEIHVSDGVCILSMEGIVFAPPVEATPEPAPTEPAPTGTGADAEFDALLSDLDDGPSESAGIVPPLGVTEIDLDDLIGSLD
jgi:hypothetical protein